MADDDLKHAILELANQQRALSDALKAKPAERKDVWDKLSAMSSFISGVVVALVGLYFTNTYEQQQSARDAALRTQELRLAEVELLHKFIPELNGTDEEKRLAIIAISALGNSDLATKFAALDRSEGARSALEALVASGDDREKRLAERALSNFKAFEGGLSSIAGGSRIGRAALDRAIKDWKSGVWEKGGVNTGERIGVYLSAARLPNGVPWSAAFVSWCFSAGTASPPFKPSGSWVQIEDEFRRNGWIRETGKPPQPGDVMFIKWPQSTARHGGIVLRFDNGVVETIEGNVADRPEAGEAVMLAARRRPLESFMTFGRVPD